MLYGRFNHPAVLVNGHRSRLMHRRTSPRYRERLLEAMLMETDFGLHWAELRATLQITTSTMMSTTFHSCLVSDNLFAMTWLWPANTSLGLVMYNSTSQKWFNFSSSSYSYYGLANNGMAHFVPSFGPNGLLMAFGGSSTTDQQLVPMDTVSMFDPWTQQWRSQATTGDVPGETENACVVGAEGDEGTYEVQTSSSAKTARS
jgi:hypothetical protein